MFPKASTVYHPAAQSFSVLANHVPGFIYSRGAFCMPGFGGLIEQGLCSGSNSGSMGSRSAPVKVGWAGSLSVFWSGLFIIV